jgi:CDP-diglyceride synthetase
MQEDILFILYFFLPAMVANIVPVFADRYNFFPSFNKPLDGNLNWRGKRILGDHKTVRGVVVGTITGALIGLLQGSPILGLGMGLGALWGDAIKSFIKRRLGIKPGTSWIPWDQIDFIIGASIFTFPISPQPLVNYFIAAIIIGAGSFLTSYIGVRTGIKKSL